MQNASLDPLTLYPGEAPRATSARARIQSWNETRVRAWLLASGVLLGIVLFYSINQTKAWLAQRDVILKNVVVNAKVVEGLGESGPTEMPGKRLPPGSYVTLNYSYNGQDYSLPDSILDIPGFVVIGQVTPLHIDPANPTNWTVHDAPPSLALQLVAVVAILPLLLGAILVAFLRQRAALRQWTVGNARQYVVLSSKNAALAPRSRIARCAPVDGIEKRVEKVTVPLRMGEPLEGDSLWLIVGTKRGQGALLAASYIDPKLPAQAPPMRRPASGSPMSATSATPRQVSLPPRPGIVPPRPSTGAARSPHSTAPMPGGPQTPNASNSPIAPQTSAAPPSDS